MPAYEALETKFSMRLLDHVVTRLRGTWIHYVFNKLRRIKQLLVRQSEGEKILLQRYRRVHGKDLNLTNPQKFTEKLFWRMISWNRGDMPPRFTQLSDKYAVRAYVASTVGEEHLIKLLWHGFDQALMARR